MFLKLDGAVVEQSTLIVWSRVLIQPQLLAPGENSGSFFFEMFRPFQIGRKTFVPVHRDPRGRERADGGAQPDGRRRRRFDGRFHRRQDSERPRTGFLALAFSELLWSNKY